MLAEGIIDQHYTTLVPLIEGNTYKFTVLARNSVGYSQESA
jgi:hypothetical protein